MLTEDQHKLLVQAPVIKNVTHEAKVYQLVVSSIKIIVSLPLTTIIYYPFVDCQGGDLLIHNESIDPSNYTCYNTKIAENSIKIKPVSNQLIIFRSGYPHCVRPFQGSRRSLILNPWEKRVNGS